MPCATYRGARTRRCAQKGISQTGTGRIDDMTLEELLDFSSCVHYLDGPHVFVEALEHMSNWNKFAPILYDSNTDVAACKLYLAAEALTSKREYIITKISARITSIGEFDFLRDTPADAKAFKPFLASRYATQKALTEFAATPEYELTNVTKMYATEYAKGVNARFDVLGLLRARLKKIYKARLLDCVKDMRRTLMRHKEKAYENTENTAG